MKVAKLERSKLKKEQTAYMPIIPDIEKCPEHLLPMKQWEDAFMADFSELRLVSNWAQLSCVFVYPIYCTRSLVKENKGKKRDKNQKQSILLSLFKGMTCISFFVLRCGSRMFSTGGKMITLYLFFHSSQIIL